MSLSWHQRKARLALLLKIAEDEDSEAEALDRLMHGQTVIGKTSESEVMWENPDGQLLNSKDDRSRSATI